MCLLRLVSIILAEISAHHLHGQLQLKLKKKTLTSRLPIVPYPVMIYNLIVAGKVT